MTPETEQALLDEFKKLTSYLVKPLMEILLRIMKFQKLER